MSNEESTEPREPRMIKTQHLMRGAFRIVLVGAIALVYWLCGIGTLISPPAPVLIIVIFVPICIVWECASYRRDRRKAEET